MAIQYQVHDHILKEYNELKFKKSENQYLIIELKKGEKGEEFGIHAVGKKGSSWEEFLSRMPDFEARFGIYDFCFTNKDGMKVEKLLFIHWLPDNTPIKNKVPYASGKESLKKVFGQQLKEFGISSRNEFKEEDIIKELDK